MLLVENCGLYFRMVAVGTRIDRQFLSLVDVAQRPEVVVFIADYIWFFAWSWIVDIPRHRETVKVSGAPVSFRLTVFPVLDDGKPFVELPQRLVPRQFVR